MFKTALSKIAGIIRDFFIEAYYAELDNIENFYRQYR